MVGVRESRRIQGLYNLTATDVFAYRKFEDGDVRCAYPMDVHSREMNDEIRLSYDECVPVLLRYFEVPFRFLIPFRSRRILMAGRCVSCDFWAQSSLRIQPIARALGDAAGTGAALAVMEGIPVSSVNGSRVRADMKHRGAAL